jgi:hypothetical protein
MYFPCPPCKLSVVVSQVYSAGNYTQMPQRDNYFDINVAFAPQRDAILPVLIFLAALHDAHELYLPFEEGHKMSEARARVAGRGGGGAARRAERTSVKIETAKYIERNIPNFEILNEEALEIIEPMQKPFWKRLVLIS